MAATKRVRRNEEIDAQEVRVIDAEGEQAGVMPLADGIELARNV
ncbi:MAG: translation initiation factor IF-3, partial [Gammaproteobacteria bacterium]|nr:translation initiation factor IF-3 [Gammaproteobacteria bacterium]